MTENTLQAPIVAVAVFQDRARITRRGKIRLPAGDQEVIVEPLPLRLRPDSVRVGGRGPATVLGVEINTRHHVTTPDESAADIEEEMRSIESELAELQDADDVQFQIAAFLEHLARRAGRSFASSLASGQTESGAVMGFADSLADRMSLVRSRRRELADLRLNAGQRLAATQRRLESFSTQRVPDRQVAVVTFEVAQESEVEVELSYVVDGARWESAYDARLSDDNLTLTWHGLVRQSTGEDWPACELTLSTARPAEAATLPELRPWYLDRVRPQSPPTSRMAPMPMAAGDMAMPASRASADTVMKAEVEYEHMEIAEAAATVDQGLSAATYTPARTVAVPADGAVHRSMIAELGMEVALDYVTAPLRSADVHIRATAVNSSPHTLPPGAAAIFHGSDFVGSAQLRVWAPGEEVELALGLDDRIRVERELVRRTAAKASLGSTQRREVEYLTSIANHTDRPAKVVVLDQLPVSRDHEITVKQLLVEPEPAETTDLGIITWVLELAPGAKSETRLGLRVDLGKAVALAGWRE